MCTLFFLHDKHCQSRKLLEDFQSVGVKMEWLQSLLYSSLSLSPLSVTLFTPSFFSFIHPGRQQEGKQSEYCEMCQQHVTTDPQRDGQLYRNRFMVISTEVTEQVLLQKSLYRIGKKTMREKCAENYCTV